MLAAMSTLELPEDFWDDENGEAAVYTEPPFDDTMLARIRPELGYTLPAAYVEMARQHNGGTPRRGAFPTTVPTGWADDHVQITGIAGIGDHGAYGLLGELGSRFRQSEWGYPDIGIYFADDPTGGHSLFCLDYRACGPDGEPSVVYVDQEDDFRILTLAPSFAEFVRRLRVSEDFDTD